MFVEHELIKPESVEFRDYQENIAKVALTESTLVVLPTGMGKTVIALRVIAEVLRTGSGKVLFMAPTKPLVEQHAAFLRQHLLRYEPVVFTGEVAPSDREVGWGDDRLVVSTPQVVDNDITSGFLDLSGFDLIVFDEAHRAVGDYSYVPIGRRFALTEGLALGMTASPGSDVHKIAEVCENLGITGVEIRSEHDEDVVNYIQQVKMEIIGVEMPKAMARVVYLLKQIFDDQIVKLRAFGFTDPKKPPSTKDLLAAGASIRGQLQTGRKSYNLFRAASAQALAMKINHGIELAETQGRGALENYLYKQMMQAEEKKRSKASQDLIKDARFEQVMNILRTMEADHPKLEKIVPLLRAQFASKPDSRVIVFTHYRGTCDLLTNLLDKTEGFRPVRFVGQSSKGEDIGLKQKEQREVIERFKSGEHNILVATSIAEEGLDIPATDLVVFFEPVPSEVRTIQRRGRTGRTRAGRVVVFVTRNTKDEAYLWSSKRKESQMRRELDGLRRKLRARKGLPEEERAHVPLTRKDIEGMIPGDESEMEERSRKTSEAKGQKSLVEYGGKGPSSAVAEGILVSRRIEGTELWTALEAGGFHPEAADLEHADVVVSHRTAVTVRSVQEFIDEISDGSMQAHLGKMKQAFLHPVLIVQGPPEGRGVQSGNAAVYDALNRLLSGYHMPVLSTADASETGSVVIALRKGEDSVERRAVQSTLDSPTRQMFMVQGLPNVSASLAERLLKRFGNVREIADAEVEDLMQVDGIVRVIAEGIHDILGSRSEEE
ncbi:MAG: DEAD/DEAH box helicase family protein [Thermoplasmata archaeon]|nr:DEAD/DEAH box helicase family protein [Thermoplasmata archaeon]